MHNIFKEIIDSDLFKFSIKAIKEAGKVLEKLSPDLSISNTNIFYYGIRQTTLAEVENGIAGLLYEAFVKKAGYAVSEDICYIGFGSEYNILSVAIDDDCSEEYKSAIKRVANEYNYKLMFNDD